MTLPKHFQKRRDELGNEFVFECSKYSGYPEHIKTYEAGYDQAFTDLMAEVTPLIEALNKIYDLDSDEGRSMWVAADNALDAWKKKMEDK